MIYGIGSKSLGEQLGVVEQEAAVFLSTFRETYPGVKWFMDATLTECRQVCLDIVFLYFLPAAEQVYKSLFFSFSL